MEHSRVHHHRDRDMLPAVDSIDQTLQVIRAFNEEGVEYVVGGGVAVNLHGLIRATENLDVLLTRIGEATAYADLESEVKEVGSVRVRVATPQTLYRMKRNTVRPIDHADAATLKAAFDLEDE
jgi:hypothetical protein